MIKGKIDKRWSQFIWAQLILSSPVHLFQVMLVTFVSIIKYQNITH